MIAWLDWQAARTWWPVVPGVAAAALVIAWSLGSRLRVAWRGWRRQRRVMRETRAWRETAEAGRRIGGGEA